MLNLFKKNANDVRTIAEKIDVEPQEVISYFDAFGVKIAEHSLLDEQMCQMLETYIQQKREVLDKVTFDDDNANNNLIRDLVVMGNEYVRQQDFIKAFNDYYISTLYGNEQIYYKLGLLCEKDLGLGVNEDKAREYYRKAAHKGHKTAIQKLNDYYINHVEQIVNEGNPDDLVGVGSTFLRKGDIPRALEYYNKAVEKNSAAAQCKIGSIMMKYPSYETDLEKNHIYWLKLSAEQGYPDAYYKLGVCYEGQDTIVEEDKNLAIEYFEKAASAGNALAQSKLGYYYKNGSVVKKDYEMSFYWYKKGAENGHSIAQNQLALCYAKGLGTEMDLEQAFRWFEKAAQQKHYVAQYQLGLCYMYGKGTEIDYAKAREWFEKAIDNGYDAAQKQLDVLNKLDRLNGHSTAEQLKENISDGFGNFKVSDDFDMTSYKSTGDFSVNELSVADKENAQESVERSDSQTNWQEQSDQISQNDSDNADLQPESSTDNASNESSLPLTVEKRLADIDTMTEKEAINMMFRLVDKIKANVDLSDVQRRLSEIEQEEKRHTAETLLQQKGFTQEQLELLKDYFNK